MTENLVSEQPNQQRRRSSQREGRRSRIAVRWDACKRWMKIAWPALVAEGMSTALLVWMGCASCVSYDADPCATPPVPDIVKPEPALSFGLMVMMNTMLFGHVSGAHMNPAVTVGAVICHQLNIHVAGPYILAQTLGGMLGYGILYATVPGDKSASVCVTMPGTNVTQISALLVEIVITFTLVLVMCNIWVGDPMDPTAPIKVGLSYTGLIYSAFGATGASLNPARSIAPALFQNNLGSLWIYIVGPTAGGALAGLFARFVMRLPIPEIEPGLPPDA